MKYNYLNADEAEERFERRNKTLNLFSIMLSKKLRGAEGEEEEGGGEGAEASGSGRVAAGGTSKGKGKAQDLGLVSVAIVMQERVYHPLQFSVMRHGQNICRYWNSAHTCTFIEMEKCLS